MRLLPPCLVSAPGLRRVESEVKQGVRAGGDVAANTTVWQFYTWPVILASWRATPAVPVPFFSSAISSSATIASGSPRVRDDVPLQRAECGFPVPGVVGQQCLHPPRRGMSSQARSSTMAPAATPMFGLVTKHDRGVAAASIKAPGTPGSPSRQITNPDCGTGGGRARFRRRPAWSGLLPGGF